jgi:HEAT repeat protein
VALGIFWGPSGREVAIALDPKASHFERENAHKALIRRRDQRAVRPLLDALMGGYALEDWQCIATLGELGALGGERQVGGELLKYVGLDAETDRPLYIAAEFGIEVGRALWEMNAQQAIQTTEKALRAPLVRQRAAAALVVAGWHDESIAPDLMPLLNDPDEAVRSAATRALAELNVTESLPLLEAQQTKFSV